MLSLGVFVFSVVLWLIRVLSFSMGPVCVLSLGGLFCSILGFEVLCRCFASYQVLLFFGVFAVCFFDGGRRDVGEVGW